MKKILIFILFLSLMILGGCKNEETINETNDKKSNEVVETNNDDKVEKDKLVVETDKEEKAISGKTINDVEFVKEITVPDETTVTKSQFNKNNVVIL